MIRKALVLAAGRSTRLAGLAPDLPKPMLPIGGRPLLEHTVLRLAAAGITDLVINIHHRGEALAAHFADGSRFGVSIRYSPEPVLLGTAGAIRQCAPMLGDEPFMVVYGDNLSTCSFSNLIGHHERCGGAATIALFHRDDPSPHSAVAIDADTRITAFVEKPRRGSEPSKWISAGLICFDPKVVSSIPAKTPCDIGFDVFPKLLQEGRSLYGYFMSRDEGLWWIDTPQDYERTNREWQEGISVR